MGHSGGDRCFVCMVHDRWIEVAWQLCGRLATVRCYGEFVPKLVASPAVTRGVGQSLRRVVN